jgi:hypothetical protein
VFTALLLFCVLFSCNRQSHWALDQIHSEKKEFCSTKLTYYSRDPIHGIDVEFLKTKEHLNVYLNIHSIPITPCKEDPKHVLLTLKIEGETQHYSAYRLSGGQRFLLPSDIAELLIETLSNGKEVALALTGYHALLKPEDFPSKYGKLLHPFPLQNPFQLPF